MNQNICYTINDWQLIETKTLKIIHRYDTGEPNGYYKVSYYYSPSTNMYHQEKEYISPIIS